MGKRGRKGQHEDRLVICKWWQCPRPAHTKGYCHKHHLKVWRWHGEIVD